MTSKERVIATINHQEPDRVPIGEWGIDHDHISKIIGRHTYWRNGKDTTVALWEGRRDEVVDSMKTDYAELIEKLDYDVIPVPLVPNKGCICPDPPKQVGEGHWEDSAGNVYKYAASNDSIMCMTHPPAKESVSADDIDKAIESLKTFDQSHFEVVDYIGDKFGKERAIVFRGINIYGKMMDIFGGDQTHQLVLTAMSPDEIKKMSDYAVQYNKMLIEHCAEHNILITMSGLDFGTNAGCMMSPQSIREIFFPAYKAIANETKKHGMYPFFHCCGKIWDILDDYVDSGYMGYQSIQGTAGMNLGEVKKRYGNKLTLWAGIQCETLVEGALNDVEEEVRNSLEIAMPGGGFIFGSTNSVQYGAKTENYLRALDIVREHGIY
ncbi:MAG: hypothetical protein K8R02_00775 [Anaerohalosphaeraceae bacterium]|nr:hypothetical protein [Anaerohalosphaeraceae bacterium]